VVFAAVSLWVTAFDDDLTYNDDQDSGPAWFFVVQGLTCIGTGALIRRWWAIALGVAPVFIAIPFGFPNDSDLYEPVPLFFGYVFAAPVWAVLLALGVGIGKVRGSALRLPALTVCAVGVLALVPVSYATEISDPDVVPDRPTLGQFVRSLQGRPGAICNSLSDTLLFKSYHELGAAGRITCLRRLSHDPSRTLTLVRTYERHRPEGAILRATDAGGRTVYMWAAARLHQWTIMSIRSRPEDVRQLP
jgi:hypothetical protein